METKDLMIGDLVFLYHNEDGVAPYDEAVRWEKDDFGFTDEYVDIHIHPIPLTPEILEKNGFKDAGFYAELLWNDAFQIICDCASLSIRCKNSDLSLSIPCDMVHKLQHALRLCGIEKEIVL